ncbi:unnamed protein product [Calypogeia fissa]
MTMGVLNRPELSRSLLFSVATVLTLTCSLIHTSTGFPEVFVSTGNRVTSIAYAHSLIRPNGVSSFFTTMPHDNRRLLLIESCAKSDISIFQAECHESEALGFYYHWIAIGT